MDRMCRLARARDGDHACEAGRDLRALERSQASLLCTTLTLICITYYHADDDSAHAVLSLALDMVRGRTCCIRVSLVRALLLSRSL
jgi:hypothetical protein